MMRRHGFVARLRRFLTANATTGAPPLTASDMLAMVESMNRRMAAAAIYRRRHLATRRIHPASWGSE